MKKIWLIGLLVIGMVLVGGCKKEEVVEDTKEIDTIKKAEEALQMSWDEDEKREIIKSTVVTSGEVTRVTSFVVEWVGFDTNITDEELKGLAEMGHIEGEEKYFVVVQDYKKEGKVDKKVY